MPGLTIDNINDPLVRVLLRGARRRGALPPLTTVVPLPDSGCTNILCANCVTDRDRRAMLRWVVERDPETARDLYERTGIEVEGLVHPERVAYSLSDKNRGRNLHTFGTEIEVEFQEGEEVHVGWDEYGDPYYDHEGGRPFDLGSYANSYAADPPFLSGWRAVPDGSLSNDGAELVSPILDGPGGIAEVLYTMKQLRLFDADPSEACGGHITIGQPDKEARLRAAKLFTVMEEAMFAATGSFRRYAESSWCPPIKKSFQFYNDASMRCLKMPPTEKYGAFHDRTETTGAVEFRYPPGTLNGTQFVINLGLCQLVMRLGETLSEDLVDRLVAQTRPKFYSHGDDREGIHAFILYGLAIAADQGWVPGGSFRGLPYDPNGPLTVILSDKERDLSGETSLPRGEDIIERMERQIHSFYRRGVITGASDAISILHGDPTETAWDTLESLTGSDYLKLPSAANTIAVS